MTALLEFLRLSGKDGRSAIAAYLLDVSGDWRDRMFNTLALELRRSEAKQPRPFSTFGQVRLTAFAWTPRWPRPPLCQYDLRHLPPRDQ